MLETVAITKVMDGDCLGKLNQSFFYCDFFLHFESFVFRVIYDSHFCLKKYFLGRKSILNTLKMKV